jgi:hypothetical protein
MEICCGRTDFVNAAGRQATIRDSDEAAKSRTIKGGAASIERHSGDAWSIPVKCAICCSAGTKAMRQPGDGPVDDLQEKRG